MICQGKGEFKKRKLKMIYILSIYIWIGSALGGYYTGKYMHDTNICIVFGWLILWPYMLKKKKKNVI